MDSNSLSHTRYKCQYHIVFIPKYRKRIMYGRLKADVREIIKKLCDYRNIEIVEGAVCADHVHLFILYKNMFVFKIHKKRMLPAGHSDKQHSFFIRSR